MRRADRELTDAAAVEELLRRGQVCHLGLSVPGQAPYVVPVNYGYSGQDGRALYIHGAAQGRKAGLLQAEPEVGVSITVDYSLVTAQAPCGWTSRFASLTATGKVRIAQTQDEKITWLSRLMAHYTQTPAQGFTFPTKMLSTILVARIALTDVRAKANNASAEG